MKIVDALERLRAPLNPMVALARRIGWGLAIVVGLLIVTTILTARTGDPALWPPAAGSPTVEILVVSHGYHSGLALPRALVADVAERHGRSALIAVAQRFAAYPWIEVGWGDEGFYRSVPDAASIALALPALFRPATSRRCTWWGYPPRRVRSFRPPTSCEPSFRPKALRGCSIVSMQALRGGRIARCRRTSGPDYTDQACFFAASKPFTPSTSAIIGWPRCSPLPVFRPRR